MHPVSLVALILAGAAIVSNVEAQFHYPSPYFRTYPAAALAPPRIPDGRFIFGSLTTFTFTVSTSTTTVTSTTTTTCTTSTAALSTCTAGRRRRSVLVDEHGSPADERRDGLFYNEENQAAGEETAEKDSNVESEPVRTSRQLEAAAIPYSIQPTFGAFYAPEAGYEHQAPIGRFFLALGTATVTSTATSTATSILTATCSSTTSYKTCS